MQVVEDQRIVVQMETQEPDRYFLCNRVRRLIDGIGWSMSFTVIKELTKKEYYAMMAYGCLKGEDDE